MNIVAFFVIFLFYWDKNWILLLGNSSLLLKSLEWWGQYNSKFVLIVESYFFDAWFVIFDTYPSKKICSWTSNERFRGKDPISLSKYVIDVEYLHSSSLIVASQKNTWQRKRTKRWEPQKFDWSVVVSRITFSADWSPISSTSY